MSDTTITPNLHFHLIRLATAANSTAGSLYAVYGPRNPRITWLAFTLEDGYRGEKIPGETRIPAGQYSLSLRMHGSHHKRYAKRYANHRGMVQLDTRLAYPGWSDILLHIGNSSDDTTGCLLVGEKAERLPSGEFRVLNSGKCYNRVYPFLAESIMQCSHKPMKIMISDHDTPPYEAL